MENLTKLTQHLEKKHPTDAPFQLYYRNDGRGIAGSNTGFFMLFKQGVLDSLDTAFDRPVKNNRIEINQKLINESDVWVQEIKPNGEVISQWTKVPI